MLHLIRICVMLAVTSLAVPILHAQVSATGRQGKSEMLMAQVLVLDPDGHPLEGATVTQWGMRTKVDPALYWGWATDYHGPQPRVVTKAEGIAEMPFPKYVFEKLETGSMTWLVIHPEYAPTRQSGNVDVNPVVARMERGFRIAVTAVNGISGQPITTDLFAMVSTRPTANWKLHDNGILVSPVFNEENSEMRVMQIVEGQPILFSEMIEIKPDGRSRVMLNEVKLMPGTRVEGRLADSVPRPVKNGFVTAKIIHDTRSNDKWAWDDRTPIAEDGTFVFESLPSNEIVQLIPLCDDWVSSKPDQDTMEKYYPDDQITKRRGENHCIVPQLFALPALSDETAKPVLEMQPAASVRVAVTDPSGFPLPNAEVTILPWQVWFRNGSAPIYDEITTRQVLLARNADSYMDDSEVVYPYQAMTDEQGIASFKHVPGNKFTFIRIEHDDFEMPVGRIRRQVRFDLSPGELKEISLQMQNKGTEVLDGEEDEKDDDSEDNN